MFQKQFSSTFIRYTSQPNHKMLLALTIPIFYMNMILMIKSFLLSLLVGLPVLAAVTYFFLYPRYIASQQQATAPAPIISTTAIPSPTQNPAPNCPDNDLTCFIAAVKTCSPTSTEWTSKITLFGTFIQTTKSQLTLETPETAGKCRFVSRVENVSVEFTPQALQQVKTQGPD